MWGAQRNSDALRSANRNSTPQFAEVDDRIEVTLLQDGIVDAVYVDEDRSESEVDPRRISACLETSHPSLEIPANECGHDEMRFGEVREGLKFTSPNRQFPLW